MNKRTTLLFLLPYIALAVGLAVFSNNSFAWFHFPLDDAWIHRVYAHSLAFGNGFAYNDSIQQTGFTSPFWVIITAPHEWLSLISTSAMVLAVKLTAISMVICCLYFIHQITYSLFNSSLISSCAAIFMAVDPNLYFSALSGMESVLLLTITLAIIFFTLKRQVNTVLTLMGLATISRPEAIVYLPFFALGLLMIHGNLNLLREPKFYILPALPFFIWTIFCKIYTDHWLPSTFYLKAKPFEFSIERLELTYRGLILHGLNSTYLLIPGIFLILYLSRYKHKIFIANILFIVSPIAFIIAITLSRELQLHGYYWTRWLDPATLLFTVPSVIGLAYFICLPFLKTSNQLINLTPTNKKLFSLSILLLIIINIPVYLKTFSNLKYHIIMDSRTTQLINVRAGQWINKNTNPDDLIGVNDSGAIRYFGKRHTLDLYGLNNYELATGKTNQQQLIIQADWLAIFPSWFEAAQIEPYFEPVYQFYIPAKEYTICDCPTQNQIVIFGKKSIRKSYDIN